MYKNDACDPEPEITWPSAGGSGAPPPPTPSASSHGGSNAGGDGRRGRGGRLLAETSVPGGVEHYESDDRFTSPALVRAMVESFGPIDVDPCWHEASAVRPVSHFDVRQGQDGLREEWIGHFAFVNPPWSAQDAFVRHGHDQWVRRNVEKVVFLVPAATGAAFFHGALARDADIFLLRGRPRFFKLDKTSEGTMVNTMLIALGATAGDRRCLAERLRGSWWRPELLLPIAPTFTRAGPVSATWTSPPASCVAGRARRMLCGPASSVQAA